MARCNRDICQLSAVDVSAEGDRGGFGDFAVDDGCVLVDDCSGFESAG